MDLRRTVPKPLARDARKNTWISEATWRLVDERASARQDPAKDQALILRLSRAIAARLRDDRRREAWHWIKGWYHSVVDLSLPLAWVSLKRITSERVDLYSYIPPPGENIPIYTNPFPVDDSVPKEDNIEWAVKRLRNHRSRGLLRMRAEHMKRWLAAARKAAKEEKGAGE